MHFATVLSIVVLSAVAVLGSPKNIAPKEFVIESPRITTYGVWGTTERCPFGTYAYAFRLKTENDQGAFRDDSALNVIELWCTSLNSTRTPEEFAINQPVRITSLQGAVGNWGAIFECPIGHFITGFELRSEEDQKQFDDTAANNLRVQCSNNDWLQGDGTSWGFWSGQQLCPRDMYVCALLTQVERYDPDSKHFQIQV